MESESDQKYTPKRVKEVKKELLWKLFRLSKNGGNSMKIKVASQFLFLPQLNHLAFQKKV
jgi:hypothetical protein